MNFYSSAMQIDTRGRAHSFWCDYGVQVITFFLACMVHATSLKALDPDKPLSRFTVTRWTTEDGLPQNSINAITQTPDGYIWIGTQEGLVRYDGYRFVTFDKRNTMLFDVNIVQALYVDHTGALWVAFDDAGVARYYHDRWQRIDFQDYLLRDVQTIAEDEKGRMYFGTSNDGLWQWQWQNRDLLEQPKVSVCGEQNGLSSNTIRAILPMGAHTIAVGTAKGLDFITWDESPLIDERIKQNLRYTTNGVFALTRAADSTLWCTTDFGVFKSERQQYERIDYLGNMSAGSIITDRHGMTWIASITRGLLRIDRNGRVNGYPDHNKFSKKLFTNIFEDREGHLWLGSSVGLYRLSETRFTTYTEESGLYDNMTWAIVEDNRQNIWVGSTHAVSRYNPSDGYRIDVPLQLNTHPNQRVSVRSLAFDAYGMLWAGTAIHGLYIYDPETNRIMHHFSKSNVLPDDGVRALHFSKHPRMWIGTRAGLLFTEAYRKGHLPQLHAVAELEGQTVVSFAEDSSGGMWVGTNGLLFYVTVRTNGPQPLFDVTSYNINDGLPNPIIRSLHVDSANTVWVGTRGGLARSIRSDGRVRFESFTVRDGLFDDAIFRILEDAQQRLWMSCNKGIFVIPKQQFDQYKNDRTLLLKPLVFGKSDGMPSEECNGANHPSGWKSHDGRFWFPTIAGITVVDPRTVGNPYPLPPIFLERIMSDQGILPISPEIVLDPYHARMTVEYTIPTFRAPERIRFRYRLEGLDDHWIENQTRRTVEYSHLPPGHYTLHIMAAYDETDWDQPRLLTIPIEVRPRFYQTYWFMIFSFIALVGLIGLGFRYRILRLNQRAQQLQYVVNERTAALKDALQVAETARTTAEQANALKSQFLSIASHDMKTPLSNIVATTDLMGLDETLIAEHKNDLENIQRSSFRMLNLINELLETVRLESRDIRLQIKPCNVGQIAEELVRDNTPLASRKHQRISLHSESGLIADADEEKIREAFVNYLSNAIKYSPYNSEITVRLVSERSMIRFSVSDQGPGISQENMDKLFNQFQRLGTKTTGGESSTGLGLFIVRLIAERHGGRVWAESQLGNGSTFYFELPIKKS